MSANIKTSQNSKEKMISPLNHNHNHDHHHNNQQDNLTKRLIAKQPLKQLSASLAMAGFASSIILTIICAIQLSIATPTTSNTKSAIFVKTTSGLLAGSESHLQNITSSSGSNIYKFLSVPYAQAPIGQLRFQRPLPITQPQQQQATNETSQVLDVSQMGPTCAQFRHLTNFISPLLNVDLDHQVSEDCLHLHIYVAAKSLNKQVDQQHSTNHKLVPVEAGKLLPVIVWIPGEGFDYADARQFDGSQLAAQSNAIVISVQYRVGVLGFLNAPAWNVTGNMGLFDQLAALQWINQNIENFGGDPSNVSLMGRFTGAMSISSLFTAPNQDLIRSSRSGQLLFKRVALLSGITVDRWIIDENQHERARLLAEQAVEKSLCAAAANTQNNNSNSELELECLQSLPVDQLIRMADYAWRPNQDNQLIGELMPAEAIKAGQYPTDLEAILLGETAAEGSLCLMRHMLTQSTRYGELLESGKLNSEDLHDMIRDDSRFYFKHQLSKSNPIQRALEAMADQDSSEIKNNNILNDDELFAGENLREKYITACSSYLIKYHNEEFKRSILAKNKLAETRLNINRKPIQIYHYELTYRPSYSLAPVYIKTSSHGDDIPLIFGLVFNEEARGKVSHQDLSMSLKMMQLISSFINGKKPQVNSLRSQQQQQTLAKHLSKRLAHNAIETQKENHQISWSNEGRKMTIEAEKQDSEGDYPIFTSDLHESRLSHEDVDENVMDEDASNNNSREQQQAIKNPKKFIGDHNTGKIIVFIEREAKQSIERHHQIMPLQQQQQSSQAWSRNNNNDFTRQQQQPPIRYVSRPYEKNKDRNQFDWISSDALDFSRQPSATNDAIKLPAAENNNHHHGVVMLMTLAGLIMTLVIVILGFSLLRLQRNFNRVCKVLDHHRRLLRLDHHHDHHEDDSSQSPKSEASLEAVLTLDSRQNNHHNGHNTANTKNNNRPFCNMLNKLSNIPNHQAHNDLNTNVQNHICDLDGTEKGQNKLDIQGSSIGLARRNSNNSDQLGLRMNHESFNHQNHNHP